MKRQGIVVLGMHRGGTSAVAGVLRALGVDFGKALLPPRPDNPLGFFEHRTVVRQHDALLRAAGAAWDEPLLELDEGEWRKVARRPLAAIVRRLRADFSGSPLWGLKDPRMCRLLPLWRPAFARLGVVPRFLFVLRHPAEVAASLHARDRVDSRKAQLLWLEHLLTAEAATRGESRLFLTYDSLLADWRGAVARIGEAFRIVWPRPPADAAVAAEIDGFLQPALRHHRAAAGLAGLRVAEEVFAWLSQLAAAPAPAAEISPLISDALDARRQLLGEITWRDTEANRCLRADRRLAQEIMDSQKVELADLRQASAALRADRAEAQRIMDALAAERDAARADFATLAADRTEAQRIIETLVTERDAVRGDCEVLRTDRAVAQQVMESQQAELAALQEASDALRTDRRAAQEIIEALATERDAARADFATLAADRTEAQHVIEALAAERDAARGDCEVLRTDRAAAQEIMDSQKAELADVRQASAALRADRAEAQRVIEALAAERDAARADFATLLADRKLAQEIMDSQKAELAHLHGMLALASGTFSPSREAAAGSPLHPAS